MVAVAALVEAGADMEAFDCEGRTALHLAAGCGDCAMTLRLLELGAQVNARDSVGGALAHLRIIGHSRYMIQMYAVVRDSGRDAPACMLIRCTRT